MLDKIFEKQGEFMQRLGVVSPKKENLITAFTGLVVEAAEALQETDWKPWKKTPKLINKQKALEELVDCFHFLVELFILLGFSHEDLYNAYMKKMDVNHKRQEEGY